MQNSNINCKCKHKGRKNKLDDNHHVCSCGLWYFVAPVVEPEPEVEDDE